MKWDLQRQIIRKAYSDHCLLEINDIIEQTQKDQINEMKWILKTRRKQLQISTFVIFALRAASSASLIFFVFRRLSAHDSIV